MKPRLTDIAKYALSALAAITLALASVLIRLKLQERHLIFGSDHSRLHLLEVLPANTERIAIPLADAPALAGLLFKAGRADTGYWVLLLHGSADSAFSATQVRHAEALSRVGFNVLSFDYRGFGKSGGVASEAHMYQDSEAALETLVHRGVPLDRIILLGHSLGTGPAALLAVEHRVAALVLFAAFTSLPDAAVDRHPEPHDVGQRFNSLARMAQVHVPIIIAHSPSDRVIPFSNAERLFAAAHEPKRLLKVEVAPDPYGGHIDGLFEEPELLRSTLASMLPGLSPGEAAEMPPLHRASQ